MNEFRRKDVVKHVDTDVDWKVIESTNEWVKVERQNEAGQRIVEEFAPEYLELVSKRPSFIMGLKQSDL
ncbi:TPA: hypothetical protein JI284_10285 [Acinetobacter baumannii]|uniref:Uncharacterized protein n=1 Tax=Acinetobacter baumannii TaxID=470 RepID=A0A7X5LW09_ACIBA|nr:hypothetical protein [Acinetobacter baumannii]MEE1860186.1 hypothetical protein [Acinetobacter baumannii]NCG58454.1 hypothetical protein [Acinetobacter baumannii]NDW42653.1 hypothetical protein [Acinetobacter baumannii]NHQ49230.1 hypothetical protein [Acinetobacter baumannii]HAV6020402.1 hypothetical protein [Acinetobacter baumannii]